MTELAGLLHGDSNGVDATHLAGADAERLTVPHDLDGVRERVLDDRPGKEEVVPTLGRELATDDVHRVERVRLTVTLLDEHAAEDPLQVPLRGIDGAPLLVVEDADPRFLDERLDRDCVEARSPQHLDEL